MSLINSSKRALILLPRILNLKFVNFLMSRPIVVACFVQTFILLFRDLRLNPSIFIDEYSFSISSRKLSPSEYPTPAYLFNLIYRLTNYAGDNFLAAFHILNSCFFLLTIYFVFKTSKIFLSHKLSVLAAFLTLFSPLQVYTGYLTPEILFACGFMGVIYFLVSGYRLANLKQIFALSFVCSILSLIKPQGLFLLIPLCIYFCVSTLLEEKAKKVKQVPLRLLIFVSSTLSIKLSVGYVLSGISGLSLFGSFYNNVATADGRGYTEFVKLLPSATTIAINHTAGLLVYFGISILIPFSLILSSSIFRRLNRDFRELCLLSYFLILFYVPFIGFFTASVGWSSEYETNRIHTRYYDFLFPLIYILILWIAKSHITLSKFQLFFINVLGLIGSFVWLTSLTQLNLFPFDTPEFYGISQSRIFSLFAILVGLLLGFLLWFLRLQLVAQMAIAILSVVSVFSWGFTSHAIVQSGMETRSASFGKVLQELLSQEQKDNLAVINTDPALGYQLLFNIDSSAAKFLPAPSSGPVDLSEVGTEKSLFVVPSSLLVANGEKILSFSEFSIYKKVRSRLFLDFRANDSFLELENVTGLSQPEKWGTWSDEKDVILTFKKPLPKQFKLDLVVKGFGPNLGQKIPIKIGSFETNIVPNGAAQSFVFDVTLKIPTRQISISIPKPTSPAQLNLGQDKRKLGVGLVTLTLIPKI